MGTVSENNSDDNTRDVRIKVALTNKRPFVNSLATDLKETFFPDDPFRGLKEQSKRRRALSVLQYYVPIAEWGPKYTFAKLRYDLLAGVTIASLAIPQGISYAKLAQLPPIIGLYSSFVPPIVYAIFGSSKNLAVGTVAAASILTASIIGEGVSPTQQTEEYVNLVFTAAFVTGVFQTIMGVFRLGIFVDFLSRSTITGFMGGTAILIMLQQLKGMLGMSHFTSNTDVISVLHSVFHYHSDWKWQSAVMGIILLGILLYTRYLKTAKPKLFWISAIAPLLLVIFGGLFAFLVHGETHGIPIVGNLNKGLNPISIGKLQFKSKHFGLAFKAGIMAGFIALAEGIAVGRSLAKQNDQVDGNKEMIAYGLMNIAGSFTSCYLTTGPFSKSAVNAHSGCKSQMSNMVQAIIVMLVLLFLAPFFKYTPLVVLSAIIIVAMIGLIEYEEVYHLYKVDKFDFIICMTAFLGVPFVSMDFGLMLSVGFSIIRALAYVARPHTCKLGALDTADGERVYRDSEQYSDAVSISGILILQLGSPIYFANVGYTRERIMRWLEQEENFVAKINGTEVRYIVLDLSGVSSIDNMGTNMLMQMHKTLQSRGIKMALANPGIRVVDKLVRSKAVEIIGAEWIFLTIKDSVKACNYWLEESKQKEERI